LGSISLSSDLCPEPKIKPKLEAGVASTAVVVYTDGSRWKKGSATGVFEVEKRGFTTCTVDSEFSWSVVDKIKGG